MLARRLAAVSNAMADGGETAGLPIGLFGASTGGGAALVAAAESPSLIRAVVSRGGRPDLAGDALPHVVAPTLLIVGSLDTPVIAMNRSAYAQMRCEREITIVDGASHLFEEEGTLEEAARLARDWFRRYLVGDEPAR
jgi:putative phosphoribosyl transferase